MASEDPTTCSLCGQPIPATTGGQCPRCLFGFASETGTTDTDDAFLSPSQLRYFGDYELEEEIARGGMGIVYRAKQVSLNRPVAIKMILAGQLASPESVARFRLEAEAAAGLDHPNIIPVYEVGEYETQHYFSMKLIDGGQPISRPAASSDLTTTIVRFEKVVRAISYAHSHGILHRDIKPHNILVGKDGEPIVTDFGLAKLIGETTNNLTLTTTVLGSPAYMAPEQAAGERNLTTAADIYSLGAVLYELLSGHPPFEGRSTLSILGKLQDQPPAKLRHWNAAIHPDLETICLKCLEKKQNDRYATALNLAEDLARFRCGEPVTARPLTTVATAWRWCQCNPAVALLSAAVVAALVTGITGVFLEKNRTARANVELAQSVDRLEWKLIDAALERGDRGGAVAHLAATLRANPNHWQAANYATSILEQHPFPLLARPIATNVTSAAISTDGTLVATAHKDSVIKINDRKSLTFGKAATALFFSSNATRLAAGNETSAVIFDLATGASAPLASGSNLLMSACGETVLTLDGTTLTASNWEGSKISSITLPRVPQGWATLPSGSSAFTWNNDTLDGWNLSSGALLFSKPLDSPIKFLEASGDGTRLIFADRSGHFEIDDALSGKRIARHRSNASGLQHAILDQTGARSFHFFHDGSTQVIDPVTGSTTSSFPSHDYDYSDSSISQDRSTLLVAGTQRRIRLLSLRDRSPRSEPIYVKREHPKLSLTPDAQHILIRDGDEALTWKTSTPIRPESYSLPGGRFLNPCTLTPDGRWIVIATARKTVVLNRATGEPLYTFSAKGSPYSQLYDPTTTRLTTVTDKGELLCHDLTTGTLAWEFGPTPTAFRVSLITPDFKHIVAGADDGFVRVFDANSGKLLRKLTFGRYVRALNIFPDGHTVLACGDGGNAARFDIHTGTEMLRFQAHPSETTIVATAITPDGTRIATASYDHTARIWDATTGDAVSPPLLHLDELSHLTFSPDSTRLATAAREGSARLWRTLDGSPLSPWMTHPRPATTTRFSPEGERLIVRHFGGFRIWDAHTGQPISVDYASPSSTGLGIDFPMLRDIISSDGNSLRLGVHADTFTLWDITPPPAQCPAWFPDFLEAIARKKLQPDGALAILPPEAQLEIRKKLIDQNGWHADRAKRILGE